jgi:N-acetylglucosaminyldiphosphoundecaprenol N-acetyl-beta-D-mannosaminyltransferase
MATVAEALRFDVQRRVEVLGCLIDNLSMEETLQEIGKFVDSGRPHQHVVVNVDKIVKAHRDGNLREIVNQCDLINVDGMPVVWASRLLGRGLKERVAGIDLFERLLERAAEAGWRVYFLGAHEHVVAEVVQRAQTRHQNLIVSGYRNGYWHNDEETDVATSITRAKPDILFVAISSPKKEEFLSRHRDLLRVPFAMGVGGSFDVFAGLTRRAPKWMQRSGFEWFYRFLQEPKRMFRRYFVDDLLFFWLLGKALWHQPLVAAEAEPESVRAETFAGSRS